VRSKFPAKSEAEALLAGLDREGTLVYTDDYRGTAVKLLDYVRNLAKV
jgi:hypothetical protein